MIESINKKYDKKSKYFQKKLLKVTKKINEIQ